MIAKIAKLILINARCSQGNESHPRTQYKNRSLRKKIGKKVRYHELVSIHNPSPARSAAVRDETRSLTYHYTTERTGLYSKLTSACIIWWLSWRNWARPHLPTSRLMNQNLHCSQFEAFMLVCTYMDECAERQVTALWLSQAVVVLVFGRVWMGFTHCVPVPLCTRPIVSQTQCIPVPLCPRPICPSPVVSQSCHILLLLIAFI